MATRITRYGRLLMFAVLAFGMMTARAQQAPDFTLPDLDGKMHSLSDYRGKWVLVNYWATWCPPCKEELPELEVFYSTEKERVVVLGVNLEDIEPGALKAFVEEQFLSYPILLAKPNETQLVGMVTGLPTSYLITPEGKVVARQVGPVTAENIREFISDYESK